MLQQMLVSIKCGQHSIIHFNKPHRWVTSGGLGTMGFGFPAAIGAQIAEPESTVVAIVGDGGFQMTFRNYPSFMNRNLPVKIIIVNNGALGMVRQWQELLYENRYFRIDSSIHILILSNWLKAIEFGIKG